MRPLNICLFIVSLGLSLALPAFAATGDYTQDSSGLTLETTNGLTRVEWWTDDVARVVHTPTTSMPSISSVAVNNTAAAVAWQFQDNGSYLLLSTPKLTVRVESPSGEVSFLDATAATVLAESSSGTTLTATTVGSPAVASYAVTQRFDLASGEAIYGLGQHQQGVMNYVGHSVTLLQENREIGVPVMLSNRGYALLWDNPAVTTIDAGKTTAGQLSWSSEAGDAVNYYFCFGPQPDEAIAGYRYLTGDAPMFGKWAWGYWQSKERYQTQQELLDVANGYRSRSIPIDGIIQDWRYWPDLNHTTAEDGWGSHVFDPTRYPDPTDLMDTLHADNFHLLISVWAKFEVTNSGVSIPNLQELEAVGAAFNPAIPFVYPAGQGKWYDPFNADGRQVYWNQLSQQIFAHGIDGWWLDASEAELSGDWGEFRNFNTALGSGAKLFNAYPLMHTQGVYEGQRAETSQKRAIILTRSAYAGQQRNAAISWSGDIHATWDVLAKQIPAGLNFTASGIPYWNTDIGGFFSGNPATDSYAELYTRWFQYGAFCPMFRTHGTSYSKEVWRFPTATQPILTDYINLRYHLLPYIYSVAWQVTNEQYTMMRPLVMDFRSDSQINGIGDQFMFGPSLLVNPVTTAGATSRNVYLPSGTAWYDFWTGESYEGGQTITADAPIETMPLFVKAGAILPYGPSIQYAMESADPIELRVYPGSDGSFTLYEDEGDNYDYESGSYATIPFAWDESTETLTIGARLGSFPGMLTEHTFRIVFVSPDHGNGLDANTPPDTEVLYTGSEISVVRPEVPAPPAAPTNLASSIDADGAITLTWTASDGALSYRVKRAVVSGGPYTILDSGITETGYTDTTTTAGTTYYYVIAAINTGGSGANSSELAATSDEATLHTWLMLNEAAGNLAADASAKGHHATLLNAPAWGAGKGGSALDLDGNDQYVELPDGIVSDLNNITIATWVNLDAADNWSRIFDFGTGTSSYMFLTPRNAATETVRFAITAGGGGSSELHIDGTAALPTGVWTHVAVTLAGSTGILYVNGVEVGRNDSMTLQPLSLGSTTQNWIGRSQYPDPYLDGRVDDFRIYAGALGADDILALVSGTAGNLQSPWSASQDIGSPTLPGSAGAPETTAETVHLTASGSDIQGTSDQFHFAWRSWTDDGEIICYIPKLKAADPWTKAGLMFRSTLNTNAQNCFVALTPANGVTFQYRSSDGGATSWSQQINITAPYWLKLKRAGNTFTPYHSADGVNWTQSASAIALSLPSTAYVGLALTAHNSSMQSAAVFENIRFYDPSLASPTGLLADGGDGQIALDWTTASGADAYEVKRASSSGGPYTTLSGGITVTSYTDTNLSPGTTYYYVVQAASGIDRSAESTEASATTFTAAESWRLKHFGTTENTGTAADEADPDGDGANNAEERTAGTDPQDRSSFFHVSELASGASGWTITFPSTSGINYRVDYSDTLEPDSWTTLETSITGTGDTISVNDTSALEQSKRFYRVVVLP